MISNFLNVYGLLVNLGKNIFYDYLFMFPDSLGHQRNRKFYFWLHWLNYLIQY